MKHNHIVIVRLSALGDIVNATIVLQFIHQAYPSMKIDWVCEEVFAPLLQEHPLIHQVHTVNLKKLKKEKSFTLLGTTLKKLRHLPKYDLIIDLQGLLKSALVARIIGKNIHGYDKNSAREPLSSFFYTSTSQIPYEQNVIERNISLVNDALTLHVRRSMIENKECTLPLYNPLSFTQKHYIVFVIGASWSSKIYPKEKVVEVCNALSLPIYIVWGSQLEHEAAQYIEQHATNAKATPKLDLQQLSALLLHATLVIGNDTGPTHMAWAYNVPSITIFGPTNERMIFPTKKNIAVHSDSPVDISHINKKDFSIQKIDPQIIITKAKELYS